MSPTLTFKRGQRIEYTYAGGQVTPGKIIRAETDPRWLGWFIAELTDDHGTYRGCVHGGQLRSTDNRVQA